MIIDFRMRPPARGFLNIGVYDNVERTAKLTECFSMKQAPSVAQKSPELMLQEMDTAGVAMGVIPGRNGHFKGTISNDDIIKLLGDFPGPFRRYGGPERLQKGRGHRRNRTHGTQRPPQGREHGTRRAGQAHVCRRSPYLSHL